MFAKYDGFDLFEGSSNWFVLDLRQVSILLRKKIGLSEIGDNENFCSTHIKNFRRALREKVPSYFSKLRTLTPV